MAEETVRTEWLMQALAKGRLDLLAPPDRFHERAWSSVWRIETRQGELFFKAVTGAFRPEAALLKLLFGKFPDFIPTLVASDSGAGFILMRSAGKPLRPHLRASRDFSLLARAAGRLAEIQIALSTYLETLTAIGIEQRRPNAFARKLDSVLADRNIFAIANRDYPIETISRALDKAFRAAELLNRSLVPPSLDPCDFQDNNLLFDGTVVRMGDWGDAVIGHPFLSLAHLAESAGRNHQLAADGPEIAAIKAAYFAPWRQLLPNADFETIYRLAVAVRPLNGALMLARGLESFSEDHRREAERNIAWWIARLVIAANVDAG